jgi:hypothetical protein
MPNEDHLAAPLPKKVRQGSLSETELSLETVLEEKITVKWEDFILFFLGKVEEKSSRPQEKTKERHIDVIRLAADVAVPLGGSVYDLVKKKEPPMQMQKPNSFYLFDLYVKDNSQPFRFDSIGTNFKKFLGEEAGYSGEINLLKFIKKISPYTLKIQDKSVVIFLEKGKNFIPVYPSRDEFTWTSLKRRRNT